VREGRKRVSSGTSWISPVPSLPGTSVTESPTRLCDWGALAGEGVQFEIRLRWGIMSDSQLRVTVEGSDRRQ
jgi:hypothetical protein